MKLSTSVSAEVRERMDKVLGPARNSRQTKGEQVQCLPRLRDKPEMGPPKLFPKDMRSS